MVRKLETTVKPPEVDTIGTRKSARLREVPSYRRLKMYVCM